MENCNRILINHNTIMIDLYIIHRKEVIEPAPPFLVVVGVGAWTEGGGRWAVGAGWWVWVVGGGWWVVGLSPGGRPYYGWASTPLEPTLGSLEPEGSKSDSRTKERRRSCFTYCRGLNS